ncbi:methyltransferase domain-containing protein [Streptomyces sp. NBC_01092]|uniref:methyltransferase domain-containing protein n=1 Tax=Streptomyces sp. NBC_01092 TaxID=2903748 RepID=UPI003866CB30|nr:methyltransferase domain-containing protein [Streptomyces sp. NBC_01092]
MGFRTDDDKPLRPRTADDVFLPTHRRGDIGPHRSDLTALTELAHAVDLEGLARGRRTHGGPPGFGDGIEISASFLGRRTYNRYDIEDNVGRVLAERAVPLAPARRRAPARPQRMAADPGRQARHPAAAPGAASRAPALLQERDHPGHPAPTGRRRPGPGGRTAPGATGAGPCCGAGTLLIEAHHTAPGTTLLGFDLDPTARRAARQNAAPLPITVEHGDAGALPLPDRSIDRVLCNPPWGEQVGAGGRLAGHPERWWHVLARVLTDEARSCCSPRRAAWATPWRSACPPCTSSGSPCSAAARC